MRAAYCKPVEQRGRIVGQKLKGVVARGSRCPAVPTLIVTEDPISGRKCLNLGLLHGQIHCEAIAEHDRLATRGPVEPISDVYAVHADLRQALLLQYR